MRSDLNDIIERMPAQHSNDWFRDRLGRFTGSQVGRLMKSGKGDEFFSADGMKYIAEVAAERCLNPMVIYNDEEFSKYILQTTATSKTLAWGLEQEMYARELYSSCFNHKVKSCGSFEYRKWWFFASSPDGIVDDNGVIEIKCPTPRVHMDYLINVQDAKSLKDYNSIYYWQVMAHLAVTDADFCDWISYCPYTQKPLHRVRILPDVEAQAEMAHRVECAHLLANAMVAKALRNDDEKRQADSHNVKVG